MAKVELVMPKMGESIVEATIIAWTKQPGERVEADETVLEVATDKVDSEVPSPVAGKLAETLFQDGDVVPVGEVIAYIETEVSSGDAPAALPTGQTQKAEEAPQAQNLNGNGRHKPAEVVAESAVAHQPQLVGALLDSPQPGRFYSPLVMNIARTEGIAMDELDRLPGSGKEGRVTKKDILSYVKLRSGMPSEQVQPHTTSAGATVSGPQTAPVTPPATQTQVTQTHAAPAHAAQAPAVPAQHTAAPVQKTASPTAPTQLPGKVQWTPAASGNIQGIPEKNYSFSGRYQIEEMDRMRRMIADNMAYSKQISPHVSSFVEADVTNLVLWREKNKKAFQEKYGEKLTFTPIFIECLARTIREFPRINVSVDSNRLILKQDVNIGMAVALPSGNLIVPVIHNADELTLTGLARRVNDLVNRGRNNKLTPDDLANGTYSLSNVGTFGNIMGTPIIPQPQVAIMATGVIQKKPAVLETPQGDVIAIRRFMMLSHSYDHRVVDGSLGGQFVFRFAQLLEEWDPNRPV